MPLIGSSLVRPSTIIIGAWTAEDNEVEGTHSRDAGGYDDEVDLNAVVDKVNILHWIVRAWWVSAVRRNLIQGVERQVGMLKSHLCQMRKGSAVPSDV